MLEFASFYGILLLLWCSCGYRRIESEVWNRSVVIKKEEGVVHSVGRGSSLRFRFRRIIAVDDEDIACLMHK